MKGLTIHTDPHREVLLQHWGLHKEDRGHGPNATFTTDEHNTWIRCNQCGWKLSPHPQGEPEMKTYDPAIAEPLIAQILEQIKRLEQQQDSIELQTRAARAALDQLLQLSRTKNHFDLEDDALDDDDRTEADDLADEDEAEAKTITAMDQAADAVKIIGERALQLRQTRSTPIDENLQRLHEGKSILT